MKIKQHYWLAVLLSPALSGCYPEGPQFASDLDLVYTNYSSSFNFSQAKTYSIPDSVIKITGDVFNDPDGNTKPAFVSPTYSVPILAQIKQNMSTAGYTLVDKNSHPDIVLLVSAMTTTTIYYYYDWSYWDWWYPGWDPYWGWYYPGYYYPSYVTGYRSGSVFIQMVDQKSIVQQGNVAVVWSCILNGLTEGSTADVISRAQSNINKAFVQSPYLTHH